MALKIGNRKIKGKHVKKAAIVALYTMVVVMTVAGMVSPAFLSR